MNKNISFLSLSLFLTLNAFADRSWNEANDPRNLENNYEYNFNKLPLTGTVQDSHKGWADSYWPATRGYIADRWQLGTKPGDFKKNKFYTASQVRRMSEKQIDVLSPAEKFDIIRNDFEYPVAEFFKKKNPRPADWWRGLCNGWTQASLHFDEPAPIVFTSPKNGIKVPLGSSDIKGLLAYYYSYLDTGAPSDEDEEINDRKKKNPFSGYVGRRCGKKSKLLLGLDGGCDDIHPASLHIVMTNELGLRHRGIAMDRDPSAQVWNHPFVGYDLKVLETKDYGLSKDKTEGTRKEVKMEMTAYYVNELYSTHDKALEDDVTASPSYAALGKGNQPISKVVYRYILELNSRDQIIGGEWAYDTETYPDFIWRQDFNENGLATSTKNTKDDWSLLAEIVKQATAYAK